MPAVHRDGLGLSGPFLPQQGRRRADGTQDRGGALHHGEGRRVGLPVPDQLDPFGQGRGSPTSRNSPVASPTPTAAS